MRIAQLANFVGPTSGGMKVVIETLGRGYVDAGHTRIFVSPGARDEVTETEAGILVSVRAPKVSEQYRMIFQPWRVLDVLDRFRPTNIEVSDKWTLSPAARWAKKRSVGSVLFSHERLSDMLAMWARRSFGVETAVGALNRRLSKSFDSVVVTSRYAADEFADTGASLNLVPLGVDLTTFHPDAGAPVDDGVLKFCYVGRLSHEKSPQLAVATVVELHRRGHRVRLDLYGTGPDKAELQAIAGDAPVFFQGFVAGREQVAAGIAAADISLSVCPAETFGLAVLEALACGTPVVTSNRGGAHELVDASAGAAGDPNPAALADAVEALIPRLGPDQRVAARRRAEQYPWRRTVDQMLALHERLADEVPYRSLNGFVRHPRKVAR
ncbi:glycosyltransferase family 1 protein [Tessaracoccus sp. HDW20]|uniref:glycosyltransferase n=1 Tax=Tessaracoccus coleopterorum TaxID=2714950 RepID=UPI0018D3D88A|nr:glycosyltransferase [Tessaracoccus coleopterorum]NHB84064.1 glycosyltransferase family 1 protein [Tessaracoccus coleopterorum]